LLLVVDNDEGNMTLHELAVVVGILAVPASIGFLILLAIKVGE
jgi:hypothetical protein